MKYFSFTFRFHFLIFRKLQYLPYIQYIKCIIYNLTYRQIADCLQYTAYKSRIIKKRIFKKFPKSQSSTRIL